MGLEYSFLDGCLRLAEQLQSLAPLLAHVVQLLFFKRCRGMGVPCFFPAVALPWRGGAVHHLRQRRWEGDKGYTAVCRGYWLTNENIKCQASLVLVV